MESLAAYGNGEGNTVRHYYDKGGIKNPPAGNKKKKKCRKKGK